MRIAIYTRVSTRSQTTENQYPDLMNYAEAMGWTVVAHFDEQVTGYKTEADRPQFKLMMEEARKRKFDCIIFWRLDRFSREPMVKTLTYLSRLTEWKVAYKSYTEPHLDTTGPLGEIIVALVSYFNNLEFAGKSDRVHAGLDRARAEGRVGGKKPIDENVKWMIGILLKEGKSNRGIAKALKISHKTVNKYAKQGEAHAVVGG
jgi:DNA invertase Pin-like site-specific DNA recombinase